MDGMRFEGTGGDEGVQNPNGHPERAPHGVDDGDERVARAEAIYAGDELGKTAKEANLVYPRISTEHEKAGTKSGRHVRMERRELETPNFPTNLRCTSS